MELAGEIGSYDLPKVKLNGGSDGTVGNWSRCHKKTGVWPVCRVNAKPLE